MAIWTISDAGVAEFVRRDELGHMRIHLGSPVGMTDKQVILTWWEVIQNDSSQAAKHRIQPEQWLVNTGWTPPTAIVPIEPGQGDTMSRLIAWAKANPWQAAAIGFGALYLFGGKRRLL